MSAIRTLERLQVADVQQLPITSLETDEALQPRDGRMVPFKDQMRVERRSEEHIGTMRLVLEAAQGIELEPVLVAEMDGHLFVVDGHHRLDAYRRAQRDTIPVRVMPMGRAVAVLVSKLVNCAERALEMHSEQKTDAAWQYLAAVTDRGATALPEGESLRTLAARFGIGRSTVQRMIKKLPEVNPRGWQGNALDSGTGFPRWRNARDAGADWQQDQTEMTMEQIAQHEAEQLAKKIGALMERATPEAWALAVRMLGIEAAMEASNQDARDFTAETAEVLEF